MKIGYPCINWGLTSRSNATFRLKSYTPEKFRDTVKINLHGLQDILAFNASHDLNFFRISSDLIPFASHPICEVDWIKEFKTELTTIGDYIRKHDFRISMHPSQFVLITAQSEKIVENSVRDLDWHCRLLDAFNLDLSAKVQIHVGAAYGDKSRALEKFIHNYHSLPSHIKQRLVIENDDRIFDLKDCLYLHAKIGIPIIFDNLHHACLHNDEPLIEAITAASKTWSTQDGILMADYSSQEPNARVGKHAQSIDEQAFTEYLQATRNLNFDVMLEIKDKEPSALKAYALMQKVRGKA